MASRRRWPIPVLVLACLVGRAWPAASARAGPPPPSLAALAGERLEYRVRWGVLRVARAALEVEPADGGTVVLRGTARSSGWIDPIYPVRDLVESTVLAAELRPLRFSKNTKEGHGRPEVVEVELDHRAGVARYRRGDEVREPLALPPGVQDPLSCLYAYRVLAAAGAGEVTLAVTDGKRVTTGSFRELRRERIRTPAGEFDTVVVEPAIEGLGGVFRRSPKKRILIWFTDDRWRRPVRFLTEVAVGRFTMDLVGLESGSGTETAGSHDDSPGVKPRAAAAAGARSSQVGRYSSSAARSTDAG